MKSKLVTIITGQFMNKSKQIKFKRSWKHYSPGHVITPPAMLREWLVQHGYAEYLIDEPIQAKIQTRETLKIKKKNAIN